jgi:rod shape determining protein RodA
MRNSVVSLKHLDWGAIGLYFLLVVIGLINVNSSGYAGEDLPFYSMSTSSGKQLMWLGLSIFVGIFILLLESPFIKKGAYGFYAVVIFMLLAVLFFPEKNGQKSWFGIGDYGIQPSEFAKTATALALAKFLSTINIKIQNFNDRLRAFAIIAIPCVFIVLQPDPGTLLVFCSFVFVLYREGLSGNILMFSLLAIVLSILTILVKNTHIELPLVNDLIQGHFVIILVLWMIGLLIAFVIKNFINRRERKQAYVVLISGFIAAASFVFVVDYSYDHILKDHHRNRIELFLGLDEDPDGKDYNRNRAMASVGSGGFAGKGYKQATLANAKQGHVPEQTTDFAYCTWSEEFGFLGSAGIVIIFMVFLTKIILIAERQRSQFTRIYAYSVAGIFFLHFMINIGMIIGLAPVIGIPLPFISYGGSSLLSFTILLFVLIRLDNERMEVLR